MIQVGAQKPFICFLPSPLFILTPLGCPFHVAAMSVFNDRENPPPRVSIHPVFQSGTSSRQRQMYLLCLT